MSTHMVRSNFHGSRGNHAMECSGQHQHRFIGLRTMIYCSHFPLLYTRLVTREILKVERKIINFLSSFWSFVSILTTQGFFFGVNCFLTRFSSYRISVVSVTICQLVSWTILKTTLCFHIYTFRLKNETLFQPL